MRNTIEFVYFDLGNILVHFDLKVAVRNLAERFGVDTEHANACLYQSGLQEEYELGNLTSDEFAEAVRELLGVDEARMSNRSLLDASSDMFTPIESMADTVAQVAKSGTRFGLLSNTCAAHWDWIAGQTWKISQIRWPYRVVSYEVASMKPQHGIYEVAEKLAGVEPRRILFLDDRQENIDAAIDRGWNAVQCLGGEQAEKVLRDFAVLS